MSGPWCLLVLKICFSEETKNANSVSSSSLREMLRAVMVGLFLWVCRFYSQSPLKQRSESLTVFQNKVLLRITEKSQPSEVGKWIKTGRGEGWGSLVVLQLLLGLRFPQGTGDVPLGSPWESY